jgi:flagellar hook-length control protein FliK
MTTTPHVPPTTSISTAAQAAAAKKPSAAQVKGLADFLSQLIKAQQAKGADAQTAAAQDAAPAKTTGLADASNPLNDSLNAPLNNIESGSAPADTGGLDENILGKLQGRFDALTEDGQPLTPDALAAFKADALKMLKDLGIQGDDAQKYLAALTQNLGSAITNAQAAFLNAAQAITGATDTAANKPPVSGRPAGNDKTAKGGGKDDKKALESAAAAQDIAGKSLQKASDTPAGTGAPEKPGVGGLQADKSNNGLPRQDAGQQQAAAGPQPHQDNGQTGAKPSGHDHAATATAANNNASGGGNADTGGNGNSGGSAGFGNNGSAMAAADGVKAAVTTGAQSFGNVMSQTQNAPQLPQMVAVQIQRNLAANINSFTMKLDPAELGALQIRMSFGKDGSVKTRLTADKPETLSMLKNDAPALNRLLQQAGLRSDEGALSFDLNQQNGRDDDDSYTASGAGARGKAGGAVDNATMQANIAVEAMGHIRPDGVNIVV